MNIGIVTTWFPRGAAYVSRAYLDTLATRHKVFIYARGGERYARGDPEWDREYVTWGTRFPERPGTYIDPEEFQKWVTGRRLDLVLFNEQNDWEIVGQAAQLPVVIGSYVDYYTAETLPFFRLYDFLFCNTKRHHRAFRDHPQAFYVPWGADVEFFRPAETAASGGPTVFLHAAGMNPARKGTDLAVKAFRRVRGEAKLIIRIQTADAFKKCPEIPTLIKQDARIELVDREVEDPRLLYRSGSVLVYPSRRDGLGLQVAEALACGLPVIATGAEPMTDFITDGLNGRLVRVAETQDRPAEYYWPRTICDVDSLREAMQFFVDNPEQLKEFRARARRSAEENYDWKKNSRQLPDLVTGVARTGARTDAALTAAVNAYGKAGSRRGFLKRTEAAFRRFRHLHT